MNLLADESLDEYNEYDEYYERSEPIKDKINKIYGIIKVPLEEIYGKEVSRDIYNEVANADKSKDLNKLKDALIMIKYYQKAIHEEIKYYSVTPTNSIEDKLTSKGFNVYGSNMESFPKTVGISHQSKINFKVQKKGSKKRKKKRKYKSKKRKNKKTQRKTQRG
tara:strand:- start:277 stop:768 length:492 start_codon:yes stop_codon:yes gene_type:complete